jgi:hypothetical protein
MKYCHNDSTCSIHIRYCHPLLLQRGHLSLVCGGNNEHQGPLLSTPERRELQPQLLSRLGQNLKRAVVNGCSDTQPIRDDHNWSSRKYSLELIKLSRMNNVSPV